MHILAFADTHGETDLSHLHELAEKADLIVCAGDISFFGVDLKETFAALEALAKAVRKPILFIPGNHEQGDSIPESKHIINIHQSHHEHEDVVVIGYGGGGFREHDPEVEAFLSAHAPRHQGKQQIWVFHGPPYNLVIDEVAHGPTGCKSKRKMIDAHTPALVIAAHIHEQWGTIHQHKNTLVVNPGPSGRLITI